jgi:hypothetical protein
MSALPRWLPLANRIVKSVGRLGIPLGTIRVLEVPGRTCGRPRATPVSPLTVDGRDFVIAGLPQADWALNAAAAGHGTLIHRRRRRSVRLTEVTDAPTRRQVMRAFPTQVPHGVPFFVQIGLVDGPDPDQFEQAADRVRVFQILTAA